MEAGERPMVEIEFTIRPTGQGHSAMFRLVSGVQWVSYGEWNGWDIRLPWTGNKMHWIKDLKEVVAYLEFMFPSQYYHKVVKRVGGKSVFPVYPTRTNYRR